jgi:hypothetical protein
MASECVHVVVKLWAITLTKVHNGASIPTQKMTPQELEQLHLNFFPTLPMVQ